MAKKKKHVSPSSRKAHFEQLKKDTGLQGWQIYLISGALFVVAVVCMFVLVLR